MFQGDIEYLLVGDGEADMVGSPSEKGIARPSNPRIPTKSRAKSRQQTSRNLKRRNASRLPVSTALCALLASSVQTAMAQSCISLEGSTTCSAFNASSVSTDSSVVGLFPFLSSVTDTASFDSELRSYVSGGYAQLK